MIRAKVLRVFIIGASILLFAPPTFSQDGQQVRYTAEFSQQELSFAKFMGYDMVRFKDGGHLAELGKPMLPSRQIRIALPSGMQATGVQIVNTSRQEIPGEFNICPAQPPREIGLSDEKSEFVQPEARTYSSTQPYPSSVAEFLHQTDLAGQGMAVVLLYPLQYLPDEKRLILYTSITLVIQGRDGYQCGDYLSPNISERGRRSYRRALSDMVANPEDVRLNMASKGAGSAALPDGAFDHVIITSSAYASAFQPLVDWHTQKGVKDTVVTVSWIYLNYAGADTQKIRSFVIDANSTWGATYFLLGGEHETVPFVYRDYRMETSSDQYYTDFDDDWTHEVYVGRVSVQSTLEIDSFIEKVLKYEKDPPRTDYPLDILLIGMDYDANTPVEEMKESIDFGYIPAGFNVTKVYDSHPSNHRTEVINALNAGQNLVNHCDHSSIEYMGTGDFNHGWGINSSHVDALTNDAQLSIVVSTGCHPNHMDYDDCIAEHFVIYNPNQAAVAFTGNTRSGVYYEGQPQSLSNALDKQWWVGLFFWNKYNLGQTMVEAKHHFSHSNDTEKHCHWTLNLLGEPEMPIWTDEPDSFFVTHPSWVKPEPSSFAVHVEDASTAAPVNQAYVCLWKGEDVYLTGYTDANGDVSFNPSPSTEGIMYVTVTKHNYLPCQQEVDVSPYLVGDANGDEVVGPSDIVYLINYLFRNGFAPSPLEAGDASCDGTVGPSDVVYLINYLFRGGSMPWCP
ncbi:MAG: hypothetical protein GTO24_01410 [candidate division Zixibacteria bacterium]|nr:hypothetical protein [candidate division Zixibacteria bacterium]